MIIKLFDVKPRHERKELIEENLEVNLVEVQNIVSKVRSKAATAHYQQCVRWIQGGLEAIRVRMGVADMSKQEFIDHFFASRKHHDKREAAACKEFEDIIFDNNNKSPFIHESAYPSRLGACLHNANHPQE